MASSSVPKLYYTVIEDVIANVREAFIDEGVDEQALTELKQVWEKKLHESKAIREETELAATKMTQQPALQPIQANPQGAAGTITHQLAMPSGNTIPMLYTTQGSNELQKAMQLNLNQKLTLTMPAHLAQSGLQTLMQGPSGTAVQLPAEFASLFQGNVITHQGQMQHGGQQQLTNVYQALTQEQLKNAQQFTISVPVTTQQSQVRTQPSVVGQMDGANDTSDDDDDDDFQDNDDDRDGDDDGENEDDAGEEDEEPLNSDDDVSEDDPTDLFDTENVVVCQYDKITRSKNRWKFHLKDGIMNLQGKDFVFQKALGDSEW